MIRVPQKQMLDVLHRLFNHHGFNEEKAGLLARIHTESTLDGVNSHGINRIPLFIEYVEKGVIQVEAEAEPVDAFGLIERWDGRLGPGVINATKCTSRAIELAGIHGMALVALRHTNHWMRGGTYGWQAANAGCMAILFTNTIANMPPWGGRDSRIGNNPFIVSIPREQGRHVVLDMAISQYAFGKIQDYQLRGEELPFPGGWDSSDDLTRDPEKILENERGLPIGYWKGSALSMILDMLATLLSAGASTGRISKKGFETGISQVFLCIDPGRFGDGKLQDQLLDEIIAYTRDVAPMHPGDRVFYPGEKTLIHRERNRKEGIPVSEEIWDKVQKLAGTP